jgi:hypothetical protein
VTLVDEDLLAILVRLEVSLVPARTLELKASRRHLLLKGLSTARRTGAQHRIGDLLQHVFRVAAGRAAVSVDRHG